MLIIKHENFINLQLKNILRELKDFIKEPESTFRTI